MLLIGLLKVLGILFYFVFIKAICLALLIWVHPLAMFGFIGINLLPILYVDDKRNKLFKKIHKLS